jgi:predicted RNase H-like nuclease (RuvC/YqgF family)
VGIDPGVKTAVAILDLNGSIVGLKSGRYFSLKNVLKFLSEKSVPILIASDVYPAPKLIEKVAAAFSARIYEPPENYSKWSKSKLVEGFDLSERERHEKDALAAAVSAYESILPMIKRIRKKLEHPDIEGIEVGDVAMKIFSGECNNIHSAVRSLKKEYISAGGK